MPISATFASVSAINAKAANAAARRAKEERCKLTERQFDGHTATVEMKREYADCILKRHIALGEINEP